MSEGPPPGHDPRAAPESTRYLCAAAYLDRRFANWVVEEVLESELRAAAPSHGVDLIPVIRHCVRARTLRLARNLVLTAVVLGALVLVSRGVTMFGLLVRIAPLAWATVFTALCLVHYEIVTAGMLRDRFDPDAAPRVSAGRERLLRSLGREAGGNVTVYSGFTPFVGCGLDIGGWSFVVDSRRGKEGLNGDRLPPLPFGVDDLYRCTADRMRDLRLDRLGMESRLFVSGRDLAGLPWLLPTPASRPHTVADQRVVDHFRQQPSDLVRHYLAVRIVGWEGELIVSLFLRFSFTGDNLFCEASYFLLPPVEKRYHDIDDRGAAADLRTVGELLARSLLHTLPLVVIAPFAVLQRALAPLAGWLESRTQRRLARQSPTYDHGAATTVRERAMSKQYRHYFQKLDREMYVKLVEQQILDAIVTFLVTGGRIEAQNFAVGEGAAARTEQAFRKVAESVPRPAAK
jgi:hypothetical protein